jgi:hypothetical protein
VYICLKRRGKEREKREREGEGERIERKGEGIVEVPKSRLT